MLLDKASLLARLVADCDRPGLDVVRITPWDTRATNGKALVVVKHPAEDAADYPIIEGMDVTGAAAGLKPVSIGRDDAERLAKGIPTGKRVRPILRHVAVDVAATNANGTLHAGINDLESAVKMSPRKVDVSFPELEAVIPPAENRPVKLRINVNYLVALAKVMDACRGDRHGAEDGTVTLHIGKPGESVLVTDTSAARVLGVVMPVDLD